MLELSKKEEEWGDCHLMALSIIPWCVHWVCLILCLQKGRGDLGEGQSRAAGMLTGLGAPLREVSRAGWDLTWGKIKTWSRSTNPHKLEEDGQGLTTVLP